MTEGQQASLRAVLDSATDRDVTVDIHTTSRTAIGNSMDTKCSYNNRACYYYLKADLDFPGVSTTITIPAGQTEVSIRVNTLDDSIVEESEDFVVILSNPSQGLTIGANNRATVIILDDDGNFRADLIFWNLFSFSCLYIVWLHTSIACTATSIDTVPVLMQQRN